MKKLFPVLLLFVSLSANAAVTDNDDTCDIALLPAATLLLPYFEVDLEGNPGDGRTTLFTVVNTSREPQIARVTLWTDLSVPVISFNIFLTGYDVQAMNMHDVLVRGLIAPPNGTGVGTTPGSRSASNITGNPRFRDTVPNNCRPPQNPTRIPAPFLQDLQAAFTTGNVPSICATPVGTQHTRAIGYATIDVVSDCNLKLPNDASYFDDLLYDNVLTGDYQHISGSGNFANGNPLVHLRAIPDELSASETAHALPWTFYSGFVANRRDRRQPLPSAFAARFIDGGPTGFETNLQLWRERSSACGNAAADGTIEVVRFDERENPSALATVSGLASASLTSTDAFPQLGTDPGGWLYINAGTNGDRPRQAWIASVMSAEGRYSTSFDVVALGNGCSPAPAPGATIQPRPNENPTANNGAASPATTANDDSCDVGLYPAATLLIPYFEVQTNAPPSVAGTTLFTVTNVTPQPQIAHVTVHTDRDYPVLSFNIFLTGYDVQAINMYDVLVRGLVAPDTGTSNETTPGSRSLPNVGGNPNHLPSAATTCTATGQNRGRMPDVLRQAVVSALTTGRFGLLCGDAQVGNEHPDLAIGYITLDVVATCTAAVPTDDGYFDEEILFDNVLMGDYQIIHPNAATGNYAQGSPMVHIRAVPEGGAAGSEEGVSMSRTFYSRYQGLTNNTRDRRQPLPSVFAARVIEGGPSAMQTELQIWRESRNVGGTCTQYAPNADMKIAELVKFDERENPFVVAPCQFTVCPAPTDVLPVTSSTSSSGNLFPDLTSGDVGGWLYLNLRDTGTGAGANQQAWVTTRMSAQGRFSVMADATALGNGCSAAVPAPAAPIGPLP
ncbi:MAG TPA: hypothetical protein VF618_09305 [Thermoanaerobaculia bacterium]